MNPVNLRTSIDYNDVPNNRKLVQFHHACVERDELAVDFVLEKAFPINARVTSNDLDFSGNTPLHLACMAFCGRHFEDVERNILEKLLIFGANVNVKNESGNTPLHIAFQKRNKFTNSEIVDMLFLAQNYNFCNITNSKGLSYFHIACAYDKVSIVEKFLRCGVPIDSICGNYTKNTENYSGFTGLHFAVKFNSKRVTKLLINFGANVNIKNSDGLIPLYLLDSNSATFETSTVSSYLLAGKYNNNTNDISLFKLFEASQQGNFALIKDVLVSKTIKYDDQISLHSPILPGCTLLHFCTKYRLIDVLDFLLVRDVDIQDVHGSTPLHYLLDFRNFKVKTHEITEKEVDRVLSILKIFEGWHTDVQMKSHNELTPLDGVLQLTKECKSLKLIDKIVDDKKQFNNDQDTYKFFMACLQNNIELVKMTSNLNELVNTLIENPKCLRGFTPLHFAVEGNNEKIVEILLKNGANISVQNLNGLSPLHLAERKGHAEIVKLILKYGSASSNSVDPGGLSHFHIACRRNSLEMVTHFLKSNIPVTSFISKNVTEGRNKNISIYEKNDTPVHTASRANNKAIVDLFIDYEANFLLQNAEGDTPLHIAADYNHTAIGDAILAYLEKLCASKKPINVINNQGRSHFNLTCCRNFPNLLKAFLQQDKTLVHEIGKTSSLNVSIKYGNIENVKLLTEFGVDFDREFLVKSLHCALRLPKSCEHKIEIIDCIMIKLEISETEPIDSTGLALLHIATVKDDITTIERLLAFGIDVNSIVNNSNWQGWSPLHIAFYYDCFKSVSLLLRKGANYKLKNSNGQSPFDMINLNDGKKSGELLKKSLKKMKIILEAIIEANNDDLANEIICGDRTLFQLVCHFNILHKVESLLRAGAEINYPVDHFSIYIDPGFTPLHFAVDSNNLDIIKILIENNADMNPDTLFKGTPFFLSTMNYNKEVQELLLKGGASINKKNLAFVTEANKQPICHVFTALHVAAADNEIDRVLHLLKNGADINSTDLRNKTAISLNPSILQSHMQDFFLHIKALEFFNYFVDNQNKNYFVDYIPYRVEVNSLCDECQNLRGNTTRITKYTTLSDLIDASPRKMGQFVSNERFKNIIYSEKYENDYPRCGFILKLQYQRGIDYNLLLKDTLHVMGTNFLGYELEKKECIEPILGYLDIEDMKTLRKIQNIMFPK